MISGSSGAEPFEPIFDIVVPYGLPQSDDELAEIISGEISKLDPTYRTVITMDHSYSQLR